MSYRWGPSNHYSPLKKKLLNVLPNLISLDSVSSCLIPFCNVILARVEMLYGKKWDMFQSQYLKSQIGMYWCSEDFQNNTCVSIYFVRDLHLCIFVRYEGAWINLLQYFHDPIIIVFYQGIANFFYKNSWKFTNFTKSMPIWNVSLECTFRLTEQSIQNTENIEK